MIHDIKPEPKTAYGLWVRWLNHMQTKLILIGGKKIKVDYEIRTADNE